MEFFNRNTRKTRIKIHSYFIKLKILTLHYLPASFYDDGDEDDDNVDDGDVHGVYGALRSE